MTEMLLSRADIDFLLYDWLAADRLTARARYADHDRGGLDAVLDTCEAVARDRFKPVNKRADANEPRFENGRAVLIPEIADALEQFRDSGMFAAVADAPHGGLQLPYVVASACMAYFEAASIGIAAYAFLTQAASNLLATFGTPAQIAMFVEPMVQGRFFGTMCLSETQAGSSLADISTRAEPSADGSYRLFGTKMWISGGEHDMTDNIVHMVIARIAGAPAGIGGISLFVVPKYLVNPDGSIGARNDIALAGLNHKMGYRGTTNTLLNFGEGLHTPDGRPGAIGWLVAAPNRGLAAMFHMMNEARISVGRGAVALGYTGYLHALDYAKSRTQGRETGATKDTARAAVPIIRHADVRRMLLAQKAYVEGGMALVLYCANLIDERNSGTPDDAADAGFLLHLLTPIAKSWPSQWCLAANDLAIQVHGGYGYTRDYDVEQFYRDNRLNAIHEGTHGIQALDLLGRKVVQNEGRALLVFQQRVLQTVARANEAGGEAATHAQALATALDTLLATTTILHASPSQVVALANASVYLEAFGHVVVAWLWLEQHLATADRTSAFFDGKRQACRFFYRFELPKTGPQFELLASRDTTTLDMQEAWF